MEKMAMLTPWTHKHRTHAHINTESLGARREQREKGRGAESSAAHRDKEEKVPKIRQAKKTRQEETGCIHAPGP
jgi:hypothetical protein